MMHRTRLSFLYCALLAAHVVGCAETGAEQPDPQLESDQHELHSLQRLPAGVFVFPRQTLTTSEAGTAVSFWIALRSPPTAVVQIDLAVTPASEAAATPHQITFRPFDWWLPRRVTVKGLPDAVMDGDTAFSLTLTLRSSDARYAALPALVLLGVNEEVGLFQGLASSDGSALMTRVYDLSNAGDVAVGVQGELAQTTAVRWTPASGLTLLSGASGRAEGVSIDGQLTVGSVQDSRYDGNRAAVLWRAGSTTPEYFQPPTAELPPGTFPFTFVNATAITTDGQAYGHCTQWRVGWPLACRTPLSSGLLSPGSYVYAISSDGAHWVGTQTPTRYPPYVQPAVVDGQFLPFPSELGCITPMYCGATAEDISDVGAIAVGTVELPPSIRPDPYNPGPYRPTAFSYQNAWRRLPDLEGGDELSSAHTVNIDGTVIGGFGTDASGQQATLWIDGSVHSVRELLAEQGVIVPSGWQLNEVVAISSDGRTMVGNGLNPQGQAQAWRAQMTHL